MVSTYSLGRIFQIRVGFHISWIALFAFTTWAIAASLPHLPAVAAAILGALSASLLFTSVVVHEFAHALIARRFGVQTHGITLFIFGGVATLESEPPTPRAELTIALAGPLASGLLALACYGLMLGADSLGDSALAGGCSLLLAYLAVANAILAVFNLVPAFPMDGGRVLRALLWMRVRNHRAATAAAALVGVTIAACTVVASLVMLGSTRAWPYAWYATLAGFIAWSGWTHLRAARTTAG
ncbi:MAG: site-2 protease family protein [Candidatus Eremiobacteraeota bacterium]|nr:site-2 protease family protein [Candidatus Eremiobacteraeota bacterium]